MQFLDRWANSKDGSRLDRSARTVFLVLFFAASFAVGEMRRWAIVDLGVNETTLTIMVVSVCFGLPIAGLFGWAIWAHKNSHTAQRASCREMTGKDSENGDRQTS